MRAVLQAYGGLGQITAVFSAVRKSCARPAPPSDATARVLTCRGWAAAVLGVALPLLLRQLEPTAGVAAVGPRWAFPVGGRIDDGGLVAAGAGQGVNSFFGGHSEEGGAQWREAGAAWRAAAGRVIKTSMCKQDRTIPMHWVGRTNAACFVLSSEAHQRGSPPIRWRAGCRRPLPSPPHRPPPPELRGTPHRPQPPRAVPAVLVNINQRGGRSLLGLLELGPGAE